MIRHNSQWVIYIMTKEIPIISHHFVFVSLSHHPYYSLSHCLPHCFPTVSPHFIPPISLYLSLPLPGLVGVTV